MVGCINLKEFFVNIFVLEVLIINCRMKWVLIVFFLVGVFGIFFVNNIVRKNVIFEKVKDIFLV